MPSLAVWNSFGRFTRWSQSLWSPPISFRQSNRRLEPPLGSLKAWYSTSLMVVLTGVLMSSVLVTNIFSSRLHILQIVFLLIYIAMSLLIIVLFHCSCLRRQQIISIVNQLFVLDGSLGRLGFADIVGWDTVGYLMNLFLFMACVTPGLLAVFGVYENLDAIYLALAHLLPGVPITPGLILFRFLWLLLAITEVWKSVGFFSLICLLVLQIISKTLGIKTRPANRLIYGGGGKRRLHIQWRFHIAYRVYRKLQLIIFAGINPIFYFFIPYFMGFGLALCILTDFTTIVLHGQMNFALLVAMPTISVGVKFIIMTVFPMACQVHEEALKFTRDWGKLAPINNALARRMLKCLNPLRVYAGPFFYCKQSTKTRYFSVIMYYTITAVISIESIDGG